MKKKLALFLSMSMLLGSLAGCGGGKTDGGSGDAGAAKGGFPDSTITMVVNYGAGGGTDLAARALASSMEKTLGVPVSVVNKPGGSATIGITELLNAEPDGYTIGVLSYSPMIIAPNQMKVTYGIDDFDYFGTVLQYDYGLFVKADSPYQTVEDLVSAAKDGGINVMGAGYPHPLVIDGLAELTGTDMQFVNVESSAEAVTGVLGGHCEAVSLVAADGRNYIESGELRMLASSMDERLDFAPDVETLKEQGYDVSVRSYMGIGAPKGVDAERLAILQDAFDKAFENDEFKQTMENLKSHTYHISGEEFKEVLVNDAEIYKEYFADQGA
ncbi:MAG: tripartite tricarboxylate transporter substrate binding protein [Agathobaculum sp.]|jgi:tripartite-type tricarboxylate transporter receptor subunit TctC|uniref:tripartite tricarboxylate transporter substrate binding protein n=1 Tax=Agathobaculum sp. TaxID=2048138 RepID=UPI003D94BECB